MYIKKLIHHPVKVKQTEKLSSSDSQQLRKVCDINNEKCDSEVSSMTDRQQRLLVKICECVYSQSHLKPVLKTTVEEVRNFLQADRVIIHRFDSDNQEAVTFESLAPGISSLLGTNIVGKSFWESSIYDYEQGTIEAIDNIDANSFHPHQITALNLLGVKASLVVPIVLNLESQKQENQHNFDSSVQNNTLWGLLIVHHCHQNHTWSAQEVEALKLVRLQIATAIKQRLLFEEVQREIFYRQEAEAREKKTAQQLENVLDELSQTQEQLIQNEKMAILGNRIAEIANDIVHPANFIYGNLIPASQYAEDFIRLIELYQYFYPNPPDAIASQIEHLELDFIKTDLLKLLWSMRSGSERIQQIVNPLQHFSQSDNSQKRVVDLHECIDSTVRILQYRLKEKPNRPRIKVTKKFADLPTIECYSGQINLALMNILNNAIDALEEKIKVDFSFIPEIRISTEIVSSHLALVKSNESNINGQSLEKRQKIIIKIADNGQGMLPHIQRRIFEPFFTTKQTEESKGLGLSRSKQIIVDKHHGKLRCNSRFGQGTELTIEINIPTRCYNNLNKQAGV